MGRKLIGAQQRSAANLVLSQGQAAANTVFSLFSTKLSNLSDIVDTGTQCTERERHYRLSIMRPGVCVFTHFDLSFTMIITINIYPYFVWLSSFACPVWLSCLLSSPLLQYIHGHYNNECSAVYCARCCSVIRVQQQQQGRVMSHKREAHHHHPSSSSPSFPQYFPCVFN